ncbi:hypothetical protein SAMN04488021_11311 [Paracoccus aminovorans]|uniref:Uncharacterized protein n=1 Tax=Paracoccus aminovorans TaxID=34004 RepID=A0A1I3A9G1_9RHOB|nr:hypothetical protein [Paracoccus aminovorans]CQR83869.1 hypothetical protein JCM7685_pAMV1p0081 [Paracoccus aminovorans]SFH45971.1 hypothetical protein SAMN04488021_11311 [Paracoccus aminovorans]
MRRRDGPPAQLLVALCGAGVLALNFPLLLVLDKPLTVLGLPLLPVALFGVWAALIAALALASRGGGKDE